jgi:hypothetical protein
MTSLRIAGTKARVIDIFSFGDIGFSFFYFRFYQLKTLLNVPACFLHNVLLPVLSGADGDRTRNLQIADLALSQLSYGPNFYTSITLSIPNTGGTSSGTTR